MDRQPLPSMTPQMFEILLTLIDGECHGYAIMRDVAERTGGEVKLLPGALYRHLHRMLEAGIIEEVGPKSLEGDARRRCYKVTPFGLRFAEAEATRLARLVAAARARNLIKQPEPAQ